MQILLLLWWALKIFVYSTRQPGNRDRVKLQLHNTSEITCSIKDVLPVRIEIIHPRTPGVSPFLNITGMFFATKVKGYKYLNISIINFHG